MKYTPCPSLILKRTALAALLLFLLAPAAAAQTETHVPFTPPAEWTAARVWSSGGQSFARVNIQFPDGCYSIASVGPVVRQGNDLSVDFAVNRFTGGCTLAIVHKEYFFDLGALAPGSYTFTIRARGAAVRSVAFDPSQVGERWEEASLGRGGVGFAVWSVGGVTFASVSLFFPDDGYRVVEWREPERAGNDLATRVRLERWTGRASMLARKGEYRLFSLGALPPNETFTVSVEFSDGARVSSSPFTPAGQARPASMHPLDDPAFFVRQHYVDFLGREPDAEGLTFWYDDIVKNCPVSPSPCLDVKRVNVSAAFFVSLEFQRTGFYVYRMHKAATGLMPRMAEFFADTRKTAEKVVVGRAGWEELVEENQRRFAEEFVARPEFRERYPETLTPAQYVDALNKNIAHPWSELEPGPLATSERERLIAGLAGGTETRATVLRKVAAHPEFVAQEFNPAFVLLEYYGYLRRNPNEGRDTNWDGYHHWLSKLDTFRGNYVEAELVKAFITSDEYRKRFGAQ